MTLETIPSSQGWGKPAPDWEKIGDILKELQGRKVTVVNGAAAATNIAVAGIVTTDTLAAVVRLINAKHTYASEATGVVGDNNAISWTSKVPGIAGNMISVVLKDPGANGQALSVSVSGTVITVNLATDGGGAITSTAADVIAAVNGDATASALVTADDEGASDGTGVVAAVDETHLADGAGGLAGVSELIGSASITSNGNIQIAGIDTSKDQLVVIWYDKE